MVYKEPRQKIWIFLFILTLIITISSGMAYFKYWVILPITFGMFYIVGK